MALFTLLSACGGSLFESKLPAPTRYVIAPPAPAAAAVSSAASEVSLSIGRPDVAPGLDTDQIAAIRGHELDYYRGALWSGSVVETVQSFLVAAFGDQKRFHSVAAEQARIAGEYLFDVEVRDFQAEYGTATAPTVRVTLVGRLIRIRDRKLVDTISAAGTRPATENRLGSVASAFESVMQQLSLDLVQRTADAVARDRAANPPDTRAGV
ncbi:ABC-type uncharacterized transport system auxiliary subunit [Povalibacter uvarum]|uniref:ABC-type uncharacterized transport system auxiliary subunit n=1 Tax=Povalibacter uvarum TaxID=732238 RepID=A0A841HIY9_9GAMM|nr:ABC-type transport auxiliary lipoprotein family protein [Povalibacter uvarum]MBB6092683.1 ABC-type uncharacterized transport system auxiliary subunit [Povalibacter uvarum]